MKRFLLFFLVIGTINSCKVSHNEPLNQNPNEEVEPNITKVYVDQNGDFYPNNWEAKYGPHPKITWRKAYSLRKIADNKNLQDDLSNYEENLLINIKKRIENKERLIILVHGYNNGEKKAKTSFRRIQEIIGTNPEDEFIEFYWDGLVSDDPISTASIWFKAAGYSQLAGEFGLRKILNLAENKEIVMISHSRGASVVLSALSNPPYEPEFAEQTEEYHLLKVHNPTSLTENDNNIKVIMLAPAVGRIDFKTPEYYKDNDSFREFSGQVNSIHITVNATDSTLKKYIGFLSDKFNPTNLGYDIDEYNLVSKEYDFLEKTEFTGLGSHAFWEYINDPKFTKILQEEGVIKEPLNNVSLK